MNLIIDQEFKALIPPLTEVERDQLEKSLRANGCLDPIRVWDGHNIIIDGHNRYEICTRRNIEFKVTEIYMRDRETVKQWMILNQLGRRNLSPDAASLLRGKLYNASKQTKAQAGAKGGAASKDQNDTCLDTAETIAAQTGVSPATIKRDGKFAAEAEAQGVDAEVLAGKVKKREVVNAEPPPETKPKKEPKPYDLDAAIDGIKKSLQRAFDKIPATDLPEVRTELIAFLKGN